MTSIGRICRSVVNSKLCSRMSSTLSYENAVQKLNSLQSNKESIAQILRDISLGQREEKCTNLKDMESYLSRVGVPLSRLDELSVIHIAGTKGKGSTSAMCESILRHHGYSTGFFSSPHLVSVCERIRLNGEVISKDKFADYFHGLYELLETSKRHEGDMPKYFSFLTVMAYNIFLQEKVDVAIVEVGIGGVVDYTNVLRKVPVVGVTSLGLDHTSILGGTIEQIARAKSGVMKRGCAAYTVEQPPGAMDVLVDAARAVECPLHVVPDYKEYHFPKTMKKELQVDINAYYTNASLAIQLAHAWMRLRGRPALTNGNAHKSEGISDSFSAEPLIRQVPEATVEGLQQCRWPGRYQVERTDYAQFYLDGAHTKESVEICAEWFQRHADRSDKILIFSATGDRNSEILLAPLTNIKFQKVYFVVPTAFKNINEKNDNYSLLEREEVIARCHKHNTTWKNLHGNDNVPQTSVMECVADALTDIKQSDTLPQVLITGSLHLVGAALAVLDCDLYKYKE
ncbi:folylpolyglutamate synthase, mitochondrial isoform X1 [Plutella xylostella]|uniref:folylpolyglutamate synthase, mitochondrial isoform X1 n=2 Tax=Plutella xylostella TaxID=51655 RepID=UPI002032AAC0|nr:folylpolyglutamate synthase, mitochondrial isoform X1 [Plutella xylostella]